MITTDPLDLLAAARPTAADREREFPPATADAVLARVLGAADQQSRIDPTSSPGAAPRRGRRRLALLAVAAAAAGAVAIAPSLLAPGSSSASALSALAETAASQSDGPIPAGMFVHLTVTESQRVIGETDPMSSAAVGGSQRPTERIADEDRERDAWIRADGMTWLVQRVAGHEIAYRIDQSTTPFSPAVVAGLPTDAAALEAWLRAHASGSNSPKEAVFTAVGDLLRTGYAPAGVARAAIEVLAGLPEVRTETSSTPSGGSGVRVVFDDQATRPGHHYLVFDPASADLVEEGTAGGSVTYRATTAYHGLVDAVPADVLDSAVDPEQQPTAKATG